MTRSHGFLVASLGFSAYSIMSSANSDCFYFFSSLDSFYFFSSLIAVGRTFKTVFNKNVESRIFVLFLILEEMLSTFHH